ncbi:MAG: hypothetical protein ACYCYM_10135 [Saccharofermentanales bacterium]
MEDSEKAINLFKFIQEMYALKNPVIYDIDKYNWVLFPRDIPDDPENIIFNYVDRTIDSEPGDESEILLLAAHKPDFEKCPQPPISLVDWLEDGWQNFKDQIIVIEEKQLDLPYNGEYKKILFNDDGLRFSDYIDWEIKRNEWVNRQISIDKTREFFTRLFLLHIDLEKDNETLELMVGQGILNCPRLSDCRTRHPILLKRLAIKFDAITNTVCIYDTDINSEIYTSLFQEMQNIDHEINDSIADRKFKRTWT